MERDRIYNMDCLDGLSRMGSGSVDLILTSPPYDHLRKYGRESCDWNFDVFRPIAKELSRVLGEGRVLVWNVGDSVVDGGETGSSFRQALYFMDECGLKLHDTMIYEKNSSTFPARRDSKRYTQIFEYMFVFVKGDIRKDIRLIADKKNKWVGHINWGTQTRYDDDGVLKKIGDIKPIPEYSLRTNIWKYSVSFNDKTGHPAVFPEKLAEDNILSWTVEGDLVLDPFMGSGTTAKMAMMNGRHYIGFERNAEYYGKSLERVGRYAGKVRDRMDEVFLRGEELQTDDGDEREERRKTELWNRLIDELNGYFNTQSYGTLKDIRVTFGKKSNKVIDK